MRRKISQCLLVLAVSSLVAACGGGGGDGGGDSTPKTTVSGAVTFPATLAKQVAATVPPAMTVTDLSGVKVDSPKLTVDATNPKKFNYSTTLVSSGNYIFKAEGGGQVLRGIADKGLLSGSSATINTTVETTVAVLIAEKTLGLTPGALGTSAASAVTSEKLADINPAGLLAAVPTTYASLLTAVTTAISAGKDPATDSTVTAAVNAAPKFTYLKSIAVTPASPSKVIGETQQFTATGTYSDSTTKDLTASATWSSSSTSVATISSSGLATAVATGSATVTATSGAVSGTTVLTVTAVPVILSSIAVTPASSSKAVGQTQQFTATGTYSDSSTRDLTASATWSSSSTTVATISSSGLATAVAIGSSTLTATSGAFSGTATLTVTSAQGNVTAHW